MHKHQLFRRSLFFPVKVLVPCTSVFQSFVSDLFFNLGCHQWAKSEITHFDLFIFVNQNVIKFQKPVNDSSFVNFFYLSPDIGNRSDSLCFIQFLNILPQIQHAILKKNRWMVIRIIINQGFHQN